MQDAYCRILLLSFLVLINAIRCMSFFIDVFFVVTEARDLEGVQIKAVNSVELSPKGTARDLRFGEGSEPRS